MKEIKLPTLTCNRCQHSWFMRRPQLPGVCPKCKSLYWNKPRVRAIKPKRLAS